MSETHTETEGAEEQIARTEDISESDVATEGAEEQASVEPEGSGAAEETSEDVVESSLEAPSDRAVEDTFAETAIDEPLPADEAPPAAEEAAGEAPTTEAPVAETDEGDEAGEEVPFEEAYVPPVERPGDWFVVHTYAGYENKVKANLMTRIHSMNVEDRVFEVVIPWKT
jgi:transcriptional antiterminator NusG